MTRKAVMDYYEGSGDLAGIMELMLFFMENVVEFSDEYGELTRNSKMKGVKC